MLYFVFTGLIFLLFFLSNASITSFYYVCVILVLIAPVTFFFFGAVRNKLDRTEFFFVMALLSFSVAGCLSILANGQWDWSSFNVHSKFVLVICLFFAIRRHGFNEKYFFYANVIGALTAGGFAYYQAEVLNIHRVYGSTNKIISAFGIIALTSGFFSLVYIVLDRRPAKWRYMSGFIVSSAVLYTIAVTGTKGVWIALPPIMTLLILSKLKSNKWALLSVTTLTLFCIGYLVLYNELVNSRLQGILEPLIIYFQNGQITDLSISVRLETWKAALLMGLDSPIFGVGPKNFIIAKAGLIDSKIINPQIGFIMGPHNDYIGTFATQGLSGLAALFCLYWSFLRLCLAYKSCNVELFWCATGLIVIYLFSGLAGDRISSNLTATYLAMAIAILAGQISHKYWKVQTRTKN